MFANCHQVFVLPESELMMSMITGDVLNAGHHVVNQLQQGDI